MINPYSTSRVEKIIRSKIDGTQYVGDPETRLEKLLLEWEDGGGGGEPQSDMTTDDVDDVMSVISTDNDD